ncbi:MAG: TIGR00269 family protein [Candidatus Woesearchaeota archaeon]
MKCKYCNEKSIYNNLCKKHFIDYFEDKVKKTIKKYKLLSKKEKICVAASGGKDSSSLLYLLNKIGYNVEALAIDEGIKGYRDKTLEDLKKLCLKHNIKIRIESFEKNFSLNLDNLVVNEKRPCSACGILRRRLLNLFSKDYDVIATGHNLDDEAQAILMNLFKSNIELLKRLGPITGEKSNIDDKIKIDNNKINNNNNNKEENKNKKKGFTKRVKPFYFCSEKEILIYSFLNKLEVSYNECPHVFNSFRAKVRDYLNELESKKKGTKVNIVKWFLKLKFKKNKEQINYCKLCGEPSSNEICNVCNYLSKLEKTNNQKKF